MGVKANIKRNVMYAVWAVAWVAVAALLSYLWNDTQSQWYMSLVKPAFQPPGFVFAIAWSILYALIAADLFLLFRAGGSSRIIYPLILTLFLGALWNYAFFAKENASAGVLILALAVASCIYTVWQAYRKRPLYGWLLLPWLLWQSYALVLNYTIYMIN